MNPRILAIILAAGEGKRMNSARSKVLQPIGGRPMLSHILDSVAELPEAQPAVIYGHKGEALKDAMSADYPHITWIHQAQQLGTGHAVQQALPQIAAAEIVLVILGDVPLIRANTLARLAERAREHGFALLSTELDNPHGYGRIVRDEAGGVAQIIEEKDANEQQRAIREINSGIMAFTAERLQQHLPNLTNDNAQQEYYLTDLVAMSHAANQPVIAEIVKDDAEVMGVNNRSQLAQAEAFYRRRQTDALLEAGATLIDPSRIDVHGRVQVGRDVLIEPGVFFKGNVVLGDHVVVEANSALKDCSIGSGSQILSHSVIDSAIIGEHATIGPFARIRPKTVLADHTKVGNFVETKAANIGYGSKVNHLSYIGDARVGEQVNIGAGTITCNYDGTNKHQTVIEDGVFVGSNSALVAPLTINKGATVAAGSTLNKDVSANSLVITRVKPREIPNWPGPKKK
ncbi:bifunctional UDP-N-acetylglucosamine diphosphorylase/glucosamine-1-phosphate N-acetyltransferase GlmU [Suttonella sp. R2A3]|uniref:bifunctional UDP-N-acetylglucosamine diphosphorylase/glucosamine-1-phosphate N-acetyltransferase GlmU n=1 Tax=Suttonella sp. R2A3 TaxID=2908648 RepID=UPI001EFFCBAD|nr:bifunctional UDP-N-acetylglucosamine diphosphorylase/glucosamine-1-phosphate N-acetyltransferase GlmU [Suttonella sp. R2A3]UJF23966.1 bifunctional UDP-N-acetylglucosamine diphosphorylase/glucosamine-1-phosphate N-acetyltransferase GlmU [Suttonella sp. R2A3]